MAINNKIGFRFLEINFFKDFSYVFSKAVNQAVIFLDIKDGFELFFNNNEANIGVKVTETSNENIVAKEIVKAYSLKKAPTSEFIIAIGKKTTKLVPVDAKTATKTSCVPITQASTIALPSFLSA